MILFFDGEYNEHNLDLSNIYVNELRLYAFYDTKYPNIYFPKNVPKLYAKNYPYKIRNIICNFAEIQYINRHMLEICHCIKLFHQYSSVKIVNKKVISMHLSEPDLYYFCKKNCSFDSIRNLRIYGDFIIKNYVISKDVISKVTDTLTVNVYTRRENEIIRLDADKAKKIYIFNNKNSIEVLSNNKTQQVYRFDNYIRNFDIDNIKFECGVFDSNLDIKLKKNYDNLKIDNNSRIISIRSNIYISYFEGNIYHYSLLLVAGATIDKYLLLNSPNIKMEDYADIKINCLVINDNTKLNAVFNKVLILDVSNYINSRRVEINSVDDKIIVKYGWYLMTYTIEFSNLKKIILKLNYIYKTIRLENNLDTIITYQME